MSFNPDDIFDAMHGAAVGMVFSEYEWTPEVWALFNGVMDALCSPQAWEEVRAGGIDLSADEYELMHPDEFGAPF
jgi:hypothetical protein